MYRLSLWQLIAPLLFFKALSGAELNGIRENHEEQLLLLHLNHTGLMHKMAVAKTLRVYLKKALLRPYFFDNAFLKEDALFVGRPLDLSKCELSPDLYPVKDWLRLHTEYYASAYVYLRLKNDFTIVPSAREADICFGGCDEANESAPTMTGDTPVFLVPQGKENSMFSCTKMDFGVEFFGVDGVDYTCHVATPYLSSVYSPNASVTAPWNLPLARNTLLGFYGGVQRETRRKGIVHEMMDYSALHQPENKVGHFTAYFSAPREAKTHRDGYNDDSFYAEAWNLYAHSYFSWQPHGVDTFTRRAFYDSWLFGCIPVVSSKSAWFYNLIFKGQLYTGSELAFDTIVVVLPWDLPEDGKSIVEYLSKIPLEEIRSRQSKLRSLAPLMQWGWKTHKIDPFLLFLATAMN